MTTRETPFTAGTPCWVDLFTSDADRSKAFYTKLFGWTVQEGGEEFGGYANFASDGHLVAGVMGGNTADSPQPDSWNTYISTDDIDATVTAAVGQGAQVVVPAMAVADLGSMAMLIDPAGAAIGAWQPGRHTGFGKYNEPGAVTWDEVHSKDFAATVPFYASVFGWQMEKTSDTDEFRYFTGQVDGESVAGIMDSAGFLPPEVPSHWAVYFSVADADATIATAVELGGKVLRPAENTPFGRIADLTDPTGALFKIHQVVEPSGS